MAWCNISSAISFGVLCSRKMFSMKIFVWEIAQADRTCERKLLCDKLLSRSTITIEITNKIQRASDDRQEVHTLVF
jgi:hypothetical protein